MASRFCVFFAGFAARNDCGPAVPLAAQRVCGKVPAR